MEIVNPHENTPECEFEFKGDGGSLFGIMLLNYILTVVTLGLYYPWARAAYLKYMYSQIEIAGTHVEFHGTGKEMFKGFIKAFIIIFILIGIPYFKIVSQPQVYAIWFLCGYLGFLLLLPLMIHGGLRYRMSRTSWRGIHFGYRGKLSELYAICIGGGLLTIITLGIYGSWFFTRFRRYIFSNIRIGNVEVKWDGSGTDFFVLNLGGTFLSYITLGIYYFWYARDRYRFYFNNLFLIQEHREYRMTTHITTSEVFSLVVGNFFITLFTLGLGTPWAVTRTYTYLVNNLELEPGFDPALLVQTEGDYADATGDDFAGMMDMGIV